MTGGDHESDAWEGAERLRSSICKLQHLPIAPIEDIDSYFSDEELRVLAYSETDEVTTKDLTLQMIELRKRRVYLESVAARQQRGHCEEHGRLGNPRQGKYVK